MRNPEKILDCKLISHLIFKHLDVQTLTLLYGIRQL